MWLPLYPRTQNLIIGFHALNYTLFRSLYVIVYSIFHCTKKILPKIPRNSCIHVGYGSRRIDTVDFRLVKIITFLNTYCETLNIK